MCIYTLGILLLALARGGRQIEVLWDAVKFYDKLAKEVLGRSSKHVLLLHENDLAALFVGDLAKFLQKKVGRLYRLKRPTQILLVKLSLRLCETITDVLMFKNSYIKLIFFCFFLVLMTFLAGYFHKLGFLPFISEVLPPRTSSSKWTQLLAITFTVIFPILVILWQRQKKVTQILAPLVITLFFQIVSEIMLAKFFLRPLIIVVAIIFIILRLYYVWRGLRILGFSLIKKNVGYLCGQIILYANFLLWSFIGLKLLIFRLPLIFI